MQAEHDAPHVARALLLTQSPRHRWKPVLHATPHEVPSQVAVPFVGAGQAAQSPPQVLGLVLSAHTAPQRWNPGLQLNPQPLPAHVGLAFAGAVQLIAHEPQWLGSVVRSTQLIPQRVGVAPPQPLEHAKVDPLPEQTGVAPLQATPHAPQLVALPRSTSQPFAAAASQSAKPGSHAYPQTVPLHVAELFGGRAHAVQDSIPQLETAEFETQAPAQR